MMSHEKILETNGKLVKRPLVVGDDFVLTGFKEKEWVERMKQWKTSKCSNRICSGLPRERCFLVLPIAVNNSGLIMFLKLRRLKMELI